MLDLFSDEAVAAGKEMKTQRDKIREVRREQNRRDFPMTAELHDQFVSVFGDGVKVGYAEENGRRIGKQFSDAFPNLVEVKR